MSVVITVQGEVFHLDDEAERRVRSDIETAVRGGGAFVSIGGTATDVLVTPQSSVRIDRRPDEGPAHDSTAPASTGTETEFIDFSVF